MHQCIQDWLDFLIFSTFCLTDKHSKCLAVNLYNLAPGKGVIIGDTVAIAEPNFSHVSLQIKEQVSSNLEMQHQWFTLKLFFLIFQLIAFDVIRVESPLTLIINGKKASSDFQAGIELSTFAKSD